MKLRTTIKLLAAIAAAGLSTGTSTGAAGAADLERPEAEQLEVQEFVGAVPGTDAHLGIAVASDGRVLAYLCDSVGLSEWLAGTATGTTVSLSATKAVEGLAAPAVEFTGEIGTDGTVGTVKFGVGVEADVALEPATGTAGIYRGTGEFNGVPLTAGWFETTDGYQGGMISGGGLRQPAEPIDTAAVRDGTSNVTTTFIQSGVDLSVSSGGDLFVDSEIDFFSGAGR